MKKAAMTLMQCRGLSGSNTVFLQIANELAQQDYHVTLFAFTIDGLVRGEFEKHGHCVIELVSLDPFSLEGAFDLVWAGHWPAAAILLLCGKIRYRSLVFHSMSPFEGVEEPLFFRELADLLLFNSAENRERNLAQIEGKASVIFANCVSDSYLASDQTEPCFDVAYVSNHKSLEVIEALDRLAAKGYRIRKVGNHFGQALVDPAFIDENRVTISIGHTVIKGLMRDRAVYVYDRFGGPGFLDDAVYERCYARNFSGRGFGYKNADTIAAELVAFLEASDKTRPTGFHPEDFLSAHTVPAMIARLDKKEFTQLERRDHASLFNLAWTDYCHFRTRFFDQFVKPETALAPVLYEAFDSLSCKVDMLIHLAEGIISFASTPSHIWGHQDIKALTVSGAFFYRDQKVERVRIKLETGEVFPGTIGNPSPYVVERYPDAIYADASHFTGAAVARPGLHQLQFKIDGEWLTAAQISLQRADSLISV